MKAIVFDVDHTLLDFDADETEAFALTCRAAGIEPTKEQIDDFWRLSYESWRIRGLHLVHSEEIRAAFHERYRTHVKWLFANYRSVSLPSGSDELFVELLSRQFHPVADSPNILNRLSKKYDLYLATNGLSVIQQGRTKGFMPYVKKCFISEEVGAVKPDSRFFQTMLREIGLPADEILMVGDSYPSDMIGAMSVGMRTCFIRRHEEDMPKATDFIISRIDELEALL
ncbi:MAG: HAD family hydrolase [Clostridia bacterium]|nr:HAD family hydrolase [Clostridia bacterium]